LMNREGVVLQNRLACMKEIIEPWPDQELNDDESEF